jgi:conjugative element/phage-associated large polyvalent protein
MSNEAAATILSRFDREGLTPALEQVAAYVDDLNTERLRVIEEAGLESPETLQSWRDAYQYYVPLKTIQGDERPRTGKGFDIRGQESKRALGRKTAAKGLLAHTVVQAEETIVRAEKNRVGERFLNLARRYPNKDLWQIDRAVETPYFDKNTGEVRMRKDPKYKLADNVFSVKQDGKAHLITIHDEALANAMKNLGAERSGAVVRMLAAVNRYMAIINTSGNPEFLLSNFTRDVQTAMTNLTGEQSVKMAAKVLASIPMAMKGIANEMMGRPSGPWGRTYQDFQNAGGKMGFFGLRNVEEIQREIGKTVERAGKPLTKALSVIRGTRDLIFAANEVVENAVRLSAFKHAVDAGMSTERAASLAKNLTVNFNRKGELGPIANALWLFYNAGLQGSVRMIQALKSRKIQGIALAIVMASVALSALNRLLGGEDDDKVARYDKVPDGIKERNLLVMRPDGSYYKLPLPYGYNVFHVLGAQLESVLNGKRPPMEGAVAFMAAALNAFNPLGGDKTIVQTVSPTITDPIVELAINRDWSGKPIKPEQSRFELEKPQSQLYWNRVSPIAKQVSQFLNEMTGGNTIRPGLIDVSPEVLDYLVGEVSGGAGSFVNRVANAAVQWSQGKEVPVRKIPFVRVFAGDHPEHHAAADFFKFSEEVKRTMAEYEAAASLKGAPVPGAVSHKDFQDDHAVILSLRGPLRDAEHDLKKLSEQRRALELTTMPAADKEQAREALTDAIDARRKAFNREYRIAKEENRPATGFAREEALLKRRLRLRESRAREASRGFAPHDVIP